VAGTATRFLRPLWSLNRLRAYASGHRLDGAIRTCTGAALLLGLTLVPMSPLSAQPALANAPAAAASSPSANAKPAVPADVLHIADLWLQAQVAYTRTPAFVAGVVLDQELVWSKAYGHVDAAMTRPTPVDAIFSICSISKLFTSVAVMQLWEAGRLSLDDDVGKYLPQLAITRHDKDSGPISLRSLLTHSSGLPREVAMDYWNGDAPFPSREELYRVLSGQSTYLPANRRFQYSNVGMTLLGEVVAQVSGQTFDRYVHDQILTPLRMRDTAAGLPLALLDQRLPRGYGVMHRDGKRLEAQPFDTRAMAPMGGYVSTVPDLALFAQWQLRLLKQGGTELLRVSTLREMQRVQWQDDDGTQQWGLGFTVRRDGRSKVISHNGLCPGYRSLWQLLPNEQLALITMGNAVGAGTANALGNSLRRLVLKGLKIAPAKDPASLAPYIGRYGDPIFGFEDAILPWGEDLASVDLSSDDPAPRLVVLKRQTTDVYRFVLEDGALGPEARFVRDASGQVVGVRVWGQFNRRHPPVP
jgi:CubicO group peptidase (beta-lactamase class C family)